MAYNRFVDLVIQDLDYLLDDLDNVYLIAQIRLEELETSILDLFNF